MCPNKKQIQYFSIRLLINQEWVSSLNDLAAAFFTSRLNLIRKYIHEGITSDLEEMKMGIERIKKIEATKSELKMRIRSRESLNVASRKEPIDF